MHFAQLRSMKVRKVKMKPKREPKKRTKQKKNKQNQGGKRKKIKCLISNNHKIDLKTLWFF